MERMRLPSGHQICAAAEEASQETIRQRNLLRRFWRTAPLFWSSVPTASVSWSLSIGLVLTIVLLVGAAYAMNTWNRAMFDGLQNRNVATVTLLSLIYFVILVGSVSLGVIQVYLRMALQRRWCAWLNGQLIDRWLAQGRYYQRNLLTLRP